MMQHLKGLMLCLSVLYLFACAPSETEADTSSATTLFNGDNLEGWKSTGSAEASVENGELVLKRKTDAAGWLISDVKPANFELQVEFKLKPGANSGVAVRVPDGQNSDPTSSGYEINLDNRSDIRNPTGTIDFLARAFWNESIDPGGWNKLYILADGEHLQVKVNDQKVVETFSRRSMQGAMALQAPMGEAGEVRFRNMELKELPSSSFNAPELRDYMLSTYKGSTKTLFDGESLNGWHVSNTASWTVQHGNISGDSSGPKGNYGYLCTDEVYKNFYLNLKFKIAHEDNSGVFIRFNPEAEEVSLEEALEVNIYDVSGMTWAHPTGSVNTHARAFPGLVDEDDWNLMEIFAFEEQVSVYVNGVKASESEVPEAYRNTGYICLQVYPRVATDGGPSQVTFKDITLKNFDEIPFIGY